MNALGEGWRSGRGLLAGTAIATLAATAQAADLLASGNARTRITAESLDLHVFALYAALAVYGVVFGVMLCSLFAHRKAAARTNGQFHRSATVEILWSLVPWAILLGTAWPATSILAEIGSPSRADITIRATGLQWKWGYRYLTGDAKGIAFDANVYAPRRPAVAMAAAGGDYALDVDNPVVVPVNKRIRVELVTDNEIHSWHIPALGVKQFAVPGLVRDTWFSARRTGTYRGLCSIEACGAGRACVLVVVKVVSEGEYRRWVDGMRRAMAAGEHVALRAGAAAPGPGPAAR